MKRRDIEIVYENGERGRAIVYCDNLLSIIKDYSEVNGYEILIIE